MYCMPEDGQYDQNM